MKLKRIKFAITSFLSGFLLLYANAVQAQTSGEALSESLENSVFWEISGKGIKSSYLFGTHHLYDPTNIKASKEVLKCLKNTKQTVGEILIDGSAMMAMMKAVVSPDTTLKQLLSPKDYAEIEQYLKKKTGYSIELFNAMKPMIITQMIMADKYAKAMGTKVQEGGLDGSLDGFFQSYSKNKGKEVRGLESVEDQINVLFNGYSLKRQAEMLMEAVRDEGLQSMEMLKEMTKFYKDQNLNKLSELTSKSMSEQEYTLLLKNRNDKWMPQIFEMIQKKPTFFAVGAAHLVGKDGVIYRLRKEGYTVKPISVVL